MAIVATSIEHEEILLMERTSNPHPTRLKEQAPARGASLV
jgi:hypothetical protein